MDISSVDDKNKLIHKNQCNDILFLYYFSILWIDLDFRHQNGDNSNYYFFPYTLNCINWK